MSKELAHLFARRFIQRRDVKAVQVDKDAGHLSRGDWFPDIKIDPVKRPSSPHLPHGFKMSHLMAHLEGTATYGHYLLGEDSKCKLFAFDIDLRDSGTYIPKAFATEEDLTAIDIPNLRETWHSRLACDVEARTWLKYQMKMLAHVLARSTSEIGLDCAVAYSGNKGVHVYGFMPEPMDAAEVRAAALLILEKTDEFEVLKGKHFFVHKNNDPVHGFQNFSVELFPKQDSLDGKDLGNLMRLPLGVHQKNPKDPTFFLDMTSPLGQFKPHTDPVRLLTEGNPFV